MDFQDPNSYNTLMTNSSSWLEVRLFYVRVTPCVIEAVPDHLTLLYLRREAAFTPLEINGSRVPASAASAAVDLRRDRLNRESSEVTYVSTDSVRVMLGVEFEVLEEGNMVLCGSLERMDSLWGNENDGRTGWSLECYMAASVGEGKSAFFQPKLGVSAPSIEVYIAGCCGGVPVILTKTILVNPKRRLFRHGTLDAIPEDEELDKEEEEEEQHNGNADVGNGSTIIRQCKVQMTESEGDEYDLDGKFGNRYYSEDMYYGEDGQLSWFNSGVRVGVGIGLGMCLGIGIGVGLLMRSYQATTRNFRRRFF